MNGSTNADECRENQWDRVEGGMGTLMASVQHDLPWQSRRSRECDAADDDDVSYTMPASTFAVFTRSRVVGYTRSEIRSDGVEGR